jgi:hypothetical protein
MTHARPLPVNNDHRQFFGRQRTLLIGLGKELQLRNLTE